MITRDLIPSRLKLQLNSVFYLLISLNNFHQNLNSSTLLLTDQWLPTSCIYSLAFPLSKDLHFTSRGVYKCSIHSADEHQIMRKNRDGKFMAWVKWLRRRQMASRFTRFRHWPERCIKHFLSITCACNFLSINRVQFNFPAIDHATASAYTWTLQRKVLLSFKIVQFYFLTTRFFLHINEHF